MYTHTLLYKILCSSLRDVSVTYMPTYAECGAQLLLSVGNESCIPTSSESPRTATGMPSVNRTFVSGGNTVPLGM